MSFSLVLAIDGSPIFTEAICIDIFLKFISLDFAMHYSKLVEVYEKVEPAKRLEQTYIISEFLKGISLEDLGDTILLIEGRIFPRWDEREIGIASKLMVKAISLASGETKEKIIRVKQDLAHLEETIDKRVD